LVVDAAAVFGDAVARAVAQVVHRPLRRRHTDDRHVELVVLHHRIQRGEDLLAREIARHAEEHQRIRRIPRWHYLVSPMAWSSFSSWPPNSLRMAESNRSAKSAPSREVKRANSAALSTSAGTPSSTAACTVHRPSPLSETRPANSERSRFCDNACAVRSSNQL